MNVDGKNDCRLLTDIDSLERPIVAASAAGLPVIRDLIVDMTQFFKRYHSIKPCRPASPTLVAAGDQLFAAIRRWWPTTTCARHGPPRHPLQSFMEEFSNILPTQPALTRSGILTMRQRRLMNQINVVPYIDVMLVLLVIFMVTAPIIQQGTINVPSAGAGTPPPQSEGHVHGVKADGPALRASGTAGARARCAATSCQPRSRTPSRRTRAALLVAPTTSSTTRR